MIVLNGKVIARASQFSLNEVEVVTATVDIGAVHAHRTTSSRRMQAAETASMRRVEVETRLDGAKATRHGVKETKASDPDIVYHLPEEEIALVRGENVLTTGLGPRAGCGTTFVARGRRGTFCLLVEVSTAVQLLRSCTPCADS